MKRFILIVAILAVCSAIMPATAQDEASELNCTVEVNADKVQNANKEVFSVLKDAIAEYMNTTKWTDAQFGINERIECRLFLTVGSYEEATGLMKGDLQIQSMRPVYNSTYTTTILNFKDNKVEFTYMANDPLTYSETDMESNLTAILNFYAFLIIGMDFDTFGEKAGDPYYEKAAAVVRLAQSSGESGWKAFEDTRNRPSVLSAFTEKNTEGIRSILYNYHRMGLDQMVVSPDKGRAVITQQLETLKQINEAAPMSVCITMFKDSKLDELVNVYSKANSGEKESVYETLYSIYPTELTRLERIKQTE